MNSFTFYAVLTQIILTLYFMITHWVSIFPWNDLKHVSFKYERPLNAFMNCIQFLIILGYAYHINWIMVFGLIFWSLWLYGHIMAWWIPYFFGATPEQMNDYYQTFGQTYKFLNTQNNYPAPDACHTFIGILTLFVIPTIFIAYFFDGHTITFYSTLLGIFMGMLLGAFFSFMLMLADTKK